MEFGTKYRSTIGKSSIKIFYKYLKDHYNSYNVEIPYEIRGVDKYGNFLLKTTKDQMNYFF